MMVEKQRTFGGIVGLDPVVPTRLHPNDSVVCADGTFITHGEACYDCQGNAHCDEADREIADIAIVEELLNSHIAWATEYVTENDDYASAGDYIVAESSHQWGGYVKEWVRDWCDGGDYFADIVLEAYRNGEIDLDLSSDDSDDDDCVRDAMLLPSFDDVIRAICDDIHSSCIDAEWEYNHNEYATYSGSGCCLWGFDIGECEEQVDVSCATEFQSLHDDGRLEDILHSVNCDAYISCTKWSLSGDHPCFEFYHSPGGRWDCVVSKERMDQHLTEAIIRLCKNNS